MEMVMKMMFHSDSEGLFCSSADSYTHTRSDIFVVFCPLDTPKPPKQTVTEISRVLQNLSNIMKHPWVYLSICLFI